MGDAGLAEVANPSEIFLSERPEGASGSTVTALVEGTRPILAEIQALVAGPVPVKDEGHASGLIRNGWPS